MLKIDVFSGILGFHGFRLLGVFRHSDAGSFRSAVQYSLRGHMLELHLLHNSSLLHDQSKPNRVGCKGNLFDSAGMSR